MSYLCTGKKVQITAGGNGGYLHGKTYTSKWDHHSLVKDGWFWNGERQMSISSDQNLLTWNSENVKQIF